jgi:hypothetical protein
VTIRSAAALPLAIALAMTSLVLSAGGQAPAPGSSARGPQIPQEVRDRAARRGRVRVIVELSREQFGTGGARLLAKLSPREHRITRRFRSGPYIALEVSAAGLATLHNSPGDVVRIMSDPIVRPALETSVPLIEGDQVWAQHVDGSSTLIAVLDTGVDSAHPFLAGKVVEEACYSSQTPGESESFCPNGLDEQLGTGSAAPCPLDDCLHGTHVAGIAAGDGTPAGQPFSGVAKGAHLMAVQVFSNIIDPVSCGGIAPCLGAFTSDIIAALERVYTVAPQYNVAAVNMSLGGGSFSAPCDSEPYKPIIDTLRSIGIATIVASGNSGWVSSMAAPACISSVVSVGSTDKQDSVSWFSNATPFLQLLAPGESIVSSVPGAAYMELSGTSMATPHVAGTWALIKQAVPTATVDTILTALRQTGLPVADTRPGGSVTVPRVRVFEALATLMAITNPLPEATSLLPAKMAAGAAFTLTVNGSGFNAFSVVRWNGADRPTTATSTQTLEASIAATDMAAIGQADVSVFNPEPGGGTSSSLAFTIDPPPTLTVSATTIAPGDPETVTLANGFGGALDRLALAAVGVPDTSYLEWTYVGAAVTERTWTVTMPTTPGAYEFRLFTDDNTRVATSPPVTVDPSLNPRPIISSLFPNHTSAGGPAFTLAVNGNGFIASSVVFWNSTARPTTFVSATQMHASIAASDLASSGAAQVTVQSPTPGGGTSSVVSFTIDPPPTLTVSATTVDAGSSLTVTLTGSPGGDGDWLALAASTAPDASYLQSTYVGPGVTSRTWTVTMPGTAGTYEFRLYLASTYNRAATSAPVTVTGSFNPTPVASSLFPSHASAGSAAFTLTVNGSGFISSSAVQWNTAPRPTTFVSETQVRASIAASDLASSGTAQVSVQSPTPGGGTSSAMSFTIDPPPALTVSATTVTAGSSLTVTLTGSSGADGDWLALASSTAPDTGYLQSTYVGPGVTTRTWTVTMPATAGTYEFRLYLASSYNRAATSAPVTVTGSSNPAPVSSSLFPNHAAAGSAAVTLAVNGSGFIASSIVQWNGAVRPTTFVSATQVRASIAAGDLATNGTAQVTVQTPTPGGGTSSALPFTIDPPPRLTVSATTAAPGSSVTMTLIGSSGDFGDWLALAASGAPDSSYVNSTYVGTGVTTRTWTVTMPTTAGVYEFRLFLASTYTRGATSPSVTVAGSLNPVPAVSSLFPNRASAGSAAFTLSVNGSGFIAASVVQWNGAPRSTTLASATQVRASITASDLAASGTAQLTVQTPAPGGGTSSVLSFTIDPPPALTVSATSVAPGGSVTMTLTGSSGTFGDWLALAATGAPNASYVNWTYVGTGVTTRTWTVTMPATPGTYEFRLFLANSYDRGATSPPVTVAP